MQELIRARSHSRKDGFWICARMKRDNFDSGDMIPDLADSRTQFYWDSGKIEEKNFRFCLGDPFEKTGPIGIVLIKKYWRVRQSEDFKRFPPQTFVNYIEQQVRGTHISLF
jgi:hypothetical protein